MSLDDISLIDSESACDDALSVLSHSSVLGFDTESKPTFRKDEVSTGPHLIQLATETQVFLFQLSKLKRFDALKSILESKSIDKVGFGLGNDRTLLKSKLDISPDSVIDLAKLLRGDWHRGTVGAKVAVAHFFGQTFQKSKKTSTSNWASGSLTERQQLYAANDAHVALKIYQEWMRTRSVSSEIDPPTDSPLSDSVSAD